MLDQGGYFEELVHAAEFEALSRDEKRNYLNSVKMKGDYQNTIDFARDQGLEEGFNKGHEAGIAEGREIGVAEGMQKGREEGVAEGRALGGNEAKEIIAKNLSAMGMTPEQVAQATGLSEETVRSL